MPSGDRRVPFDKMRERAQAQVERTSLRHVAGDVGIDYNALNRFINGSKPRAKNAERLEAWYSAEAGRWKDWSGRTRSYGRRWRSARGS